VTGPIRGYPVRRMARRRGKRRRHPIALALLVAVAASAGCGGGGGSDAPTAADKRAALDRWQAQADAACSKANKAIAKRGWPANLIDLDRLTVRAIDEVRTASAAIQKLPAPEGSGRRIKPFVDSLKGLEPAMDELSERTEQFKPERLNDVLPTVQSALADTEEQSRKLGLRECAANDEHVWVPDAVRAPVFAQQLANLNRQITRRVNAISKRVTSRQQAARKLDRLSEIVEDADSRINTFKPPQWATEEANRYVDALRALGGTLDEGAALLSSPNPSLEAVTRNEREFYRAARLELRRSRQLLRAVGAVPVLPGGGGGGDEEAAPGGDESQAA
jgi:hypothetical protein